MGDRQRDACKLPRPVTSPFPDDAPLEFLVGPTAAGKSDLALEVAERAGAEILSLDSMLVYRGLDVGPAKPDAGARARVPHHLLDLVEPNERYHVHRYLDDFASAWKRVTAAGKRALAVGGTGFYLKALTQGLFVGPPHDQALRDELNARAAAEGSGVLHAELAAVDAESAARIHPNDAKRVVRGLEVFRASGRPLSDWQREWRGGGGSSPARIAGLDVAPEELDGRIAARTRAMLAAGWIDEARRVRARPGFGPTSIQALGYAEVLRHLDGELERDVLEQTIRLRTRQFARRQRTWFRGFPEIGWVDARAEDDPAGAILRVLGWDETRA